MFGGGAAAAQVSGTRTVPYQKTVDQVPHTLQLLGTWIF
jgi:hypothetical protein